MRSHYLCSLHDSLRKGKNGDMTALGLHCQFVWLLLTTVHCNASVIKINVGSGSSAHMA